MLAAEALETAIDRNMLAADEINRAIDALIRVAENNQSPAVAQFLIGVAQRLRRARGNVHETNSILDDALYTVQREGVAFEVKGRRK